MISDWISHEAVKHSPFHQPSLVLEPASRYGVLNRRLRASWADFQSNVEKAKGWEEKPHRLRGITQLSRRFVRGPADADADASLLLPLFLLRVTWEAPGGACATPLWQASGTSGAGKDALATALTGTVGKGELGPAWRGKASRRRSCGRASWGRWRSGWARRRRWRGWVSAAAWRGSGGRAGDGGAGWDCNGNGLTD